MRVQLKPLLRAALAPERAFVLVVLDARVSRVELEANLVDQLIGSYRKWRDPEHDQADVFVVTPHHQQRCAVLRRLDAQAAGLQGAAAQAAVNDRVDTVEKMQGQESDLTIVCYGGLSPADEAKELDFVYERARLNTAVTRAKKKCVLLCAKEVNQACQRICLLRRLPSKAAGHAALALWALACGCSCSLPLMCTRMCTRMWAGRRACAMLEHAVQEMPLAGYLHRVRRLGRLDLVGCSRALFDAAV